VSNKKIEGEKSIIDPDKKVLVRHLEGKDISQKTMKEALKE
jgi:hypothetical protein